MFKFEKLDVWQKAIDLADLVYSKTNGGKARGSFRRGQFCRDLQSSRAARPSVERIAPHADRQLALSYQLLAVA
jgi:hypothetical protein